ncbi:MFS transporter [Nocardioides sp. AE5]|uniref:MFS transporter n=1 Tax=Nocardioides sp. AE5 TaxID=2962573 RepID=UPI002880D173|nr:MFS transporter [Nocardioides sp. AE5]MDT0200832.1 MFS transporter [Nocardioides sp. AE5]
MPLQTDRALWAGLLTMAMVTGVVASLGAPMVPDIAAHEEVSLDTAQWSLTATLLAGAVTTPLIGALGTGRRRRGVMFGALGLVTVGCLLAALPLGFEALVGGRALQGIGFAINPLAIAVARDALPAHRQREAMAMISLSTVVSAGLGFPIAAGLADLLGVKGAFAVAAAACLATLVLAMLTVPPATESTSRPVDWVGAALLAAGLVVLLLAITQAPTFGVTSARVAGGGLVGLALLGACAAWLLRARIPLVDLRLAVRAGAVGANLAALLAGVGMYLLMTTVVVLVQIDPATGFGLGRSVTVAGLMMVPYAVASAIGARVSLRLADRIPPDLLLPLGCATFAGGNLFLIVAHDQVWQVAVVMAIGGLANGMTFNSIPWLMARVVPAVQTGSAIGFNVVLRYIGFSIGSALSAVLLVHSASASGAPQERGYVAAATVGLGVSLVAALACLALAGPARARMRERGAAETAAAQSRGPSHG